jgi:NarL family two-component system response regulator LiaR
LTISERTVGNHIGSILRKLHLANRTQAALYALRRGLVDINESSAGGEEKPVEGE